MNQDNVHCDICNRTLKTQKSYNEHVKSKMHVDNLLKSGQPVAKNVEPKKAESIQCECGDTITKNNMSKHKKTLTHHNNLVKKGLIDDELKKKEPNDRIKKRAHEVVYNSDETCSFPIRDKKNPDIILGYVKCDTKFLHHIINNTIYFEKKRGALVIMFDENKSELLRRYIYYILAENKETKGMVVINFNNDQSDVTLNNLKEVTCADKNRCRKQKKNATSPYFGVYLDTEKNLYAFEVKDVNGKRHKFLYKEALHAAYHRDLLVKELGLTAKLNNVNEPDDFVIKEKYTNNDQLPKGFHSNDDNTFYYTYKTKNYGSFMTLELAQEDLQKRKDNEKEEEYQEKCKQPMELNAEGIPVIKIYDKNKNVVGETMVDKDRYYELLRYTFHLNNEGYVDICITPKQTMRLSRYLTICDNDLQVDHFDHNKLNNQIANLHIGNASFNQQNKLNKDPKNKVTGVSQDKRTGKWKATITYNGQPREKIGTFNTQQEAALARRAKEEEYNKLYGANYPINNEFKYE